jgi:hypothetical protein
MSDSVLGQRPARPPLTHCGLKPDRPDHSKYGRSPAVIPSVKVGILPGSYEAGKQANEVLLHAPKTT